MVKIEKFLKDEVIVTEMRKEFRPFTVYAPREVFEEKHEKGFEEVAFSCKRGIWTEFLGSSIPFRINRLCAFYHPNGAIETYEYREDDGDLVRITTSSESYSGPYSNASFQEHLFNYHLKLGEKKKLITVLKEIKLHENNLE